MKTISDFKENKFSNEFVVKTGALVITKDREEPVTIVMVTDTSELKNSKTFEGVILVDDGNIADIGELEPNWDIDMFEPFIGDVTLTSTK